LVFFLISGCMLWTPQWHQPDAGMPDSDVSWLVEKAEAKTQAIADRGSLVDAIEAYETVLTNNPDHLETLAALAELYILLGEAYCDRASEKKAHYRKAIRYSEQAMYARAAFKRRVLEGEPTWLACRALGADGMNAMSTWCWAVLAIYRDCLGPAGRLVNYRWMPRVHQVLERMTSIDATWGNGFLDVQWGLFYLAAPKIIGGNPAQSAVHFNRAVARAPQRDLNRWFRARYRHLNAGDKQSFVADMRTVATQPADASRKASPWGSHCRRSAAEMLDHIDTYF
jgi:tetratricopeptide (TPR) repeat protein